MDIIWFYSLLSVFLVSLISFIGILTLGINARRLKTVLIYFLSFSAGALLGDAFIHLLPEVVENNGFSFAVSVSVLLGIGIFFFMEKVIHWQHCHMPITKEHVHPFAYTNLIGDALHNFIDGLIIVGGYMVGVEAGIATTIAVVLHEIPQEIGDFGVLLHGGFSKTKALGVNFLTALSAVLGAVVALLASGYIENIELFLVPLAAGGFIYIAASDLIPELHKNSDHFGKSVLQILAFILGIVVMIALLALE